MANLKNVIYLSNSDYQTLYTTGTVTINGTTLTYDPDNVYVTPDVSIYNIADEYSSSSTYAVGDLVIYDGVLYKCTTAISTAEAWNSTHWTQTNVEDEFVNLTGTQTISGVKTFTGNNTFSNSINITSGKGINAGTTEYRFYNGNFSPTASSDLGTTFYKWKDLFLSGALRDGTNSISVKEVTRKNKNVTLDYTITWADIKSGIEGGVTVYKFNSTTGKFDIDETSNIANGTFDSETILNSTLFSSSNATTSFTPGATSRFIIFQGEDAYHLLMISDIDFNSYFNNCDIFLTQDGSTCPDRWYSANDHTFHTMKAGGNASAVTFVDWSI